jgi:hypothetical protein
MHYGAAFSELMSDGLIKMVIERALRGHAITGGEYIMLARLAQTSKRLRGIIHANATFFSASADALRTHPLYTRTARVLSKLRMRDWLLPARETGGSADGGTAGGAELTRALREIHARSISEWYHLRPGQFHPLVETYHGASVSDPALSQRCGEMLTAFMSHLDSRDPCTECAVLRRPVPKEQIRAVIHGRFAPTAIGQDGTLPIRDLVWRYSQNPTLQYETYGHLCVWNTGAVEDMSSMFLPPPAHGAVRAFWSDQEWDARLWDTRSVTNMQRAFELCDGRLSGVEHWDVSAVTNMDLMFAGAAQFNAGIGNWDTSEVRSMRSMFSSAAAFNGYIGDWDTSKVASMSHMFCQAASFNKDVGGWNTGNVENMSHMFRQAAAFNRNVGSWDTSRVRFMQWMFAHAAAFDQDIGRWDTAQVTSMAYMFSRAAAFRRAVVNTWDTRNAQNTESMFADPPVRF